jgi:dihydrofolate reductase
MARWRDITAFGATPQEKRGKLGFRGHFHSGDSVLLTAEGGVSDGKRLSLIVAMTRAGVIGRDGGLPWQLSADLKRFKALTMGHHIVMGRKTFESLGRPLPGRKMIVISRQEPPPAGAGAPFFVHSLAEALRLAAEDAEVFVIGGAEIFAHALPHADRMYVTWVEADVAGDTVFPTMDWSPWREVSSERIPADARNEYETTFSVYERVAAEPAIG